MIAASTTMAAITSPIAPRGVRAVAARTDGVFAGIGGYLAILRRGVASRATTSVTMFMMT